MAKHKGKLPKGQDPPTNNTNGYATQCNVQPPPTLRGHDEGMHHTYLQPYHNRERTETCINHTCLITWVTYCMECSLGKNCLHRSVLQAAERQASAAPARHAAICARPAGCAFCAATCSLYVLLRTLFKYLP